MPLRDIVLDDFTIKSAKGMKCTDVERGHFINIALYPDLYPMIQILDSRELTFEGLHVPERAAQVLVLEGTGVRDIFLKSK